MIYIYINNQTNVPYNRSPKTSNYDKLTHSWIVKRDGDLKTSSALGIRLLNVLPTVALSDIVQALISMEDRVGKCRI